VTLGGTGKEVGDRHPKVSENVLIGASATILGNIIVSLLTWILRVGILRVGIS
jgi:serine acetyltransferase